MSAYFATPSSYRESIFSVDDQKNYCHYRFIIWTLVLLVLRLKIILLEILFKSINAEGTSEMNNYFIPET